MVTVRFKIRVRAKDRVMVGMVGTEPAPDYVAP